MYIVIMVLAVLVILLFLIVRHPAGFSQPSTHFTRASVDERLRHPAQVVAKKSLAG